jgi:hypothetical protein
MRSRGRKLGQRDRGINNIAMREETSSTACHRGSRPDATTWTHWPILAHLGPPAHEAPVDTLQQAGYTQPPPEDHLHTTFTLGSTAVVRDSRPVPTQMGPKRAQI